MSKINNFKDKVLKIILSPHTKQESIFERGKKQKSQPQELGTKALLVLSLRHGQCLSTSAIN